MVILIVILCFRFLIPSVVIGLRMNKALYSLSYTCVTAGAAGILFAGIYVLVRCINESFFFLSNSDCFC